MRLDLKPLMWLVAGMSEESRNFFERLGRLEAALERERLTCKRLEATYRRITELEGEVERLREALQDVKEMFDEAQGGGLIRRSSALVGDSALMMLRIEEALRLMDGEDA